MDGSGQHDSGSGRHGQDQRDRVRALLDDERGPLLRAPSSLREGRYAVGGRAARGVAIVVVLALLVLGGRYLLAAHASESAAAPTDGGEAVATTGDRSAFADASEGAAAAPGGAAASGPASAAPTAAPTAGAVPSGQVTVHVVGQVRSPGLVTLASGSRVGDALEEAGGASSGADTGALNLARVLVDGEQVHVPKPGETPTPAAGAPTAGAAPTGAATPGAGASGPGADGAVVNINTADLTTLETLPGIGPVLAQAIIDWREEHGGFTAVEELNEVSGIGEKTFADLSGQVTV